MAGNNIPQSQIEWSSNQLDEQEWNFSQGVSRAIEFFRTKAGLAILMAWLNWLIPSATAWELHSSDVNLPSLWATVELSDGWKVTLHKRGGGFYITWNENIQNPTDHFEWTVLIDGVVFRVVSDDVEKGGVNVESSNLWLDYLRMSEWNNILAGILLKWEYEFFSNIDNKKFQIEIKKQFWELTKDDYHELWKEIANTIGKWKIDQRQWDLLRYSNLDMLLSFSDLTIDKYSDLKLVWDSEWATLNLKMAEKLTGK